jgi:DNA-binding IscR family transcriptional regulator
MYPMGCLDAADHTCFADSHCGLQELWGDVHVAIRQVFERMTLADMVARHRKLTERPMWAPSELIRPRG